MNPNELGSVNMAGSPQEEGSVNTGSPKIDQEQFENLEKLVGSQGQELGEYRQFFKDVAPLLEKLDSNPDLVKAIIDGKIDSTFAQAALEGKIKIDEAEAITEANKEVKKEIGKKAYEAASVDEIAKLVEEKVSKVKDEFSKNLKDLEETRSFESKVNEFIANTPDFQDYAKEIDQWIDENNIPDVEVAYYAVKGIAAVRDAKKSAEEAQGEYAKDIALNATGGNSRVTYSGPAAGDVADSLIAGRSNPNIF